MDGRDVAERLAGEVGPVGAHRGEAGAVRGVLVGQVLPAHELGALAVVGREVADLGEHPQPAVAVVPRPAGGRVVVGQLPVGVERPAGGVGLVEGQRLDGARGRSGRPGPAGAESACAGSRSPARRRRAGARRGPAHRRGTRGRPRRSRRRPRRPSTGGRPSPPRGRRRPGRGRARHTR